MIDAITINTQTLFLATGNRVEETNTLDKTTVAGFAAICHCQMVERALLGAATSQTDYYHFDQYPVLLYELCTIHTRQASEITGWREDPYSKGALFYAK